MSDPMPVRSKAPKGRSPSYPMIPLGKAVERAEQLYEVVQRARVPIHSIVGAWGYNSMSGRANGTLAALKKFGLLDDQRTGDDREGQLTDLALRILIDHDRDAIQEAALLPPIHQEIFELFGENLPPGSVMRPELVRKRNFTEAGYSEFVSEYEDTMNYAGLTRSGTIEDDDVPQPISDPPRENPSGAFRDPADRFRAGPPQAPTDRKQGGANVLTIPLFGDRPPVVVEFPGKIPEADWDQFMAVLSVMKPTIIATATSTSDPDDD